MQRFFRGNNLPVAVSAIVIAANAGGAFSPLGDAMTNMLWLAGKFTAGEIISWAILPALGLILTSVWITTALVSFVFPLIAHLLCLPLYMGLLFHCR